MLQSTWHPHKEKVSKNTAQKLAIFDHNEHLMRMVKEDI